MKLIQDNPYRIAGILSNANARELERQKAKITRYASIGRQVDSELDFPFLGNIDRSESSITKAFSGIEQNQDKVSHSLFWFLKANTFDETAINYLINGDKDKAVEIWDKVTNGKEVTSKNFSCFNNIGTLKLLSNSKDEIKEGLEAKIKLIESTQFANFVHTVADQTYTIDNQKQTEKFVDDLLKQFNGKYSSSDTLKLFSNCNGTTQKYLSKKFTEEPLHNIESQIESTKNKRKTNKSGAYELGLKLFVNCKDDLATLKSLLGTSDLRYKMIADNLAKEVMQCGIDYFKELQDVKDPSEEGLKLLKYAKSIAVGSQTKERIDSNIGGMEEFKEKDITQAIMLLKSVKEAYENAYNEIVKNAYNEIVKMTKKQLGIYEEDEFIEIGGQRVRMPRLQPIHYPFETRTINYSAVEDNIKNSIDWDKVNDLLKEILPDESLERIKASSNNELKSEFTELAYWLKEYSQSNSLVSRIIDQYKKIPPKLSFKIVSSEITNTANKPLYTKFIRYIGLNLYLDVTSDMSVTFYLKYINPNGSLKRNSKSSPKGYSQSVTKTITKQTSKVILPGWGNSEKCTYELGEHRIEVYVDEYLIHTKKYTVDLAPSERLEKEIASAEKKLREINQTDYYESEIRSAKNEMSEIQKFKLFRGSSEKQSQIQAQQTKIDKLTQRSKDEKKKDIQTQEEKIYKLKMELSAAKY